MTDKSEMPSGRIARRDFFTAAAGAAAAVAVGVGKPQQAEAETSATPNAAPAGAKPGTVVLERLEAGVLLIGIDRPEANNLMDAPTLVAIGRAYHQLEHDDGLRVAVLHGRGPNFVPGLDRPAFRAAVSAGQFPPKDADFLNPLNLAQPGRSKPVVVAVHGATRTVGHELFLAADLRVAASDTVFAQDEVTAAVLPGGGATVRFTREAGWANAMRYMLTGEEWGAEEAYRLGLVQVLTPPGQQLARAIAFARKIAAAAPLAVRATLASAHLALASEEAAFAALPAEAARIRLSEDVQEFQKSVLEKRPPVYSGR
jgi:enoyl-CoA hydratase